MNLHNGFSVVLFRSLIHQIPGGKDKHFNVKRCIAWLQTQKHQHKLPMKRYDWLKNITHCLRLLNRQKGKREREGERERKYFTKADTLCLSWRRLPQTSQRFHERKGEHHHLPWILSPTWKWFRETSAMIFPILLRSYQNGGFYPSSTSSTLSERNFGSLESLEALGTEALYSLFSDNFGIHSTPKNRTCYLFGFFPWLQKLRPGQCIHHRFNIAQASHTPWGWRATQRAGWRCYRKRMSLSKIMRLMRCFFLAPIPNVFGKFLVKRYQTLRFCCGPKIGFTCWICLVTCKRNERLKFW